MRKIYLITAYFLAHTAFAMAQTVITDADLVGGETYNWTADTEYILDGNVYLEEGGVLNIEAGTVIKGRTVASNLIDVSSSLIIARGAQIFARGTADAPIIFTAEADDLSITDDLTSTDNELWGGLLILGRAPIGEDVPTGLDFAEDVIEGIPSDESRAFYGGSDAADNSGVLRYVSIRHGGAVLSGDNEIQGLSLGGVGNGTTLEYIEIFANLDDGIEIFGGTVNLKHVVVSFQGDDAIDVDESWDGFIQYALTLQQDIDTEIGDNAVEYDGSEAADQVGTRTVGRIYNATFIGSGSNGSSNGLRMKADGAAQFWNSIWTQFSGAAFRFEETSIDRLQAGETVLANNIVWDYAQLYNDDGYEVQFEEVDPLLRGISRLPDGGLNPLPAEGSPALSGAATPTEAGVDITEFRGAFGAGNWALSWTALDHYGYFDRTVSSVDFRSNIQGLTLGNAIPNPAANGSVRLEYHLPRASKVAYSVFDLTGRVVYTSGIVDQAAGEGIIDLDTESYQAGSYYVLLRTELGSVSQRFLVTQMR